MQSTLATIRTAARRIQLSTRTHGVATDFCGSQENGRGIKRTPTDDPKPAIDRWLFSFRASVDSRELRCAFHERSCSVSHSCSTVDRVCRKLTQLVPTAIVTMRSTQPAPWFFADEITFSRSRATRTGALTVDGPHTKKLINATRTHWIIS